MRHRETQGQAQRGTRQFFMCLETEPVLWLRERWEAERQECIWRGQTASSLHMTSGPKPAQTISVSPLNTTSQIGYVIFVVLGNRGIGHLLLKDELLQAALSLSHARSVLVTTGFPTHFSHEPPEETDGPPGAIALAAFLQALGKETAMVVDRRALNLHSKIVEDAVKQGER